MHFAFLLRSACQDSPRSLIRCSSSPPTEVLSPTRCWEVRRNASPARTDSHSVDSADVRSKTTPLVLVHGLSAVGLIDWSPLAESLALSRPVLIFDNRGMGGSTLPKSLEEESYGVQRMADDVKALVQHLGFEEIDLLGFSMGGMIALTVLVEAGELPFKIRHAILAATSALVIPSFVLSIHCPVLDRRGIVLTRYVAVE